MTDRGTLEKLVDPEPMRSPITRGRPVGEFQAFVNPNEITLAYEIEYDDSAQGAGTTSSRMNFKKVKPGDLSLTFFLDGTGANGRPVDVQEMVDAVSDRDRLQRQHPPAQLSEGHVGNAAGASGAC